MILIPEGIARRLAGLASGAEGETCGLLLGTQDGLDKIVRAHVEVPNEDRGGDGFFITNEAMCPARRIADGLRLAVIAVYHTHPGGDATASDTDRRAVSVSSLPWVIVAVDRAGDPVIKALDRTGEQAVTTT